jgi:hypothetical protein
MTFTVKTTVHGLVMALPLPDRFIATLFVQDAVYVFVMDAFVARCPRLETVSITIGEKSMMDTVRTRMMGWFSPLAVPSSPRRGRNSAGRIGIRELLAKPSRSRLPSSG